MNKICKQVKYLAEAMVVWPFYWFLKQLTLDTSSALCGLLMRCIGPRLKAARVARRNLKMCFPEKSDAEIEMILTKMWEHLGRIVGELPHMINLTSQEFSQRIDVSKLVTLSQQALFLSGHLGNFEIGPRFFIEMGFNIDCVYRPTNNPYVNYLIKKLREKGGNHLISKGMSGVKSFIKAIENGKGIGMLIDQKMNDGIAIQFLGYEAKATAFPARLAIKYQIPIYVMFIRRDRGCNFTMHMREVTLKKNETPKQLTQRINNVLEEWIRQYPEQWFWVHKRWG